MKASQINFVGSVIGQLTKVPQHQLTQEYVATLFADRLETRYKTNFNREEFLEAARVSPSMAEDAEEKRGTTAPLTSPREVLTAGVAVPASRSDNLRSNSDFFLRASQSSILRGCGGKR
jgi:hypothetical protein